jgi:hypothetical protein
MTTTIEPRIDNRDTPARPPIIFSARHLAQVETAQSHARRHSTSSSSFPTLALLSQNQPPVLYTHPSSSSRHSWNRPSSPLKSAPDQSRPGIDGIREDDFPVREPEKEDRVYGDRGGRPSPSPPSPQLDLLERRPCTCSCHPSHTTSTVSTFRKKEKMVSRNHWWISAWFAITIPIIFWDAMYWCAILTGFIYCLFADVWYSFMRWV